MFIYGLSDPLSGELRYIGFTIRPLDKRLKQHIAPSRLNNNHRSNWIKSLLSEGKKPEIFLIQNTDEENWQFDEQWNIAYFKAIGCKLTNATAGGEGTINYNPTLQTRLKMSHSQTGHVVTNETKNKISIGNFGKTVTKEVKDKISRSKKENKSGISESVIELILDEYWRRNSKVEDISVMFSISPSTVRKVVKSKAGVIGSSRRKRHGKLSQEQCDEIHDKFFSKGFKMNELAKIYGVFRHTISAIINEKHGYKKGLYNETT